jgi:hypothetical protein
VPAREKRKRAKGDSTGKESEGFSGLCEGARSEEIKGKGEREREGERERGRERGREREIMGIKEERGIETGSNVVRFLLSSVW